MDKAVDSITGFEKLLAVFYDNVSDLSLSERQNRLIAAKLAMGYGHGGIIKFHRQRDACNIRGLQKERKHRKLQKLRY